MGKANEDERKVASEEMMLKGLDNDSLGMVFIFEDDRDPVEKQGIAYLMNPKSRTRIYQGPEHNSQRSPRYRDDINSHS
ncbi:hypothetical protein HYW76_05275 [Candidatus Pacearchaeota archaeon]|nr:hypothetical protein [Candidatus Pacearchaeota archaeon]